MPNMTPMHNGRKIRAALAAFEGNFYKKNNKIYVCELSSPNSTKTYKFMGAIKQSNFVHA
jgi:hypothetical protein